MFLKFFFGICVEGRVEGKSGVVLLYGFGVVRWGGVVGGGVCAF